METIVTGHRPRFRLWIASTTDWRPTQWHELPPRATALEPVDEGLYTVDEAALFVQEFNATMVADPQRQLWAVAVPVTVRYEGDAHTGMPIAGHAFDAAETWTDAAGSAQSG
ncbi:MAG: hypothetical protein AB7O59_18360 [Pirellulales bacterium]